MKYGPIWTIKNPFKTVKTILDQTRQDPFGTVTLMFIAVLPTGVQGNYL